MWCIATEICQRWGGIRLHSLRSEYFQFCNAYICYSIQPYSLNNKVCDYLSGHSCLSPAATSTAGDIPPKLPTSRNMTTDRSTICLIFLKLCAVIAFSCRNFPPSLPPKTTCNLFQKINSTKLREILDSLEHKGMLVLARLYPRLARFLVKETRAQISCKYA